MGKIENKKKDGSFKCNHINHHIRRKIFIYWIKKSKTQLYASHKTCIVITKTQKD